MGASCRQASPGAIAAVDAEVGQRRWDATDNSWLCVCRVGAGGGEEIHVKTEVVVVSPLTSEAILGLDFLKRHRARIDLENKQLHLTDCTLPLRELEPVTAVKRKVRAERTAEVPPFSVMEVIAYLKELFEESTMWLLEETTEKRAAGGYPSSSAASQSEGRAADGVRRDRTRNTGGG